MLEKYFSAPKTLARLRWGPSGPYIDGFAEVLERDSYSQLTAVRYLRGQCISAVFCCVGAAPPLRLMQAGETQRELSVGLRKSAALYGDSEAVALSQPIMPVGDGFGG